MINTAKNDILIAYIDNKSCVHKYLTLCKTNPQPPGLADFLRGTIALYNLTKLYDYKLFIECSHPMFNYLKPNKNFIVNDSFNVIELLPPLSYPDIYDKLNTEFKKDASFYTMTNSFYNLQNGSLTNFGFISDECRYYMQNILSPSEEINKKIQLVFTSVYNINIVNNFKIIHLRFGDQYLYNNIFDENLYNLSFNKISELVDKNSDVKFILLSDSSIIANKLKKHIPLLNYWDNSKTHMGGLNNSSDIAIFDTMTDFFIMSKSNEILVLNDSGFSRVISIIYNIKYTYL